MRVPVHNDRDPGGTSEATDGDRSEDHQRHQNNVGRDGNGKDQPIPDAPADP